MGRHQSNSSRRQFLTALAGTGGAMLLAPYQLRAGQPSPPDVDPRVAEIVSKTIAVDMHNHLAIQSIRLPAVKNPVDTTPDPDIDLAGAIKRSGFSAICETYDIDHDWNRTKVEAGTYYKYNLMALAFEDRLLAKNNMRRALTLKDLQTAHAQRQPIIVQSAEGSQFIEGHLERVEEVYKRGLRHLGLLHEADDMVSPLGAVYTSDVNHTGGLTPFGAQVVKECNRLGIVVDLAHATAETVTDALKVASQPLLISHTGLIKETPNADMRRRLISIENAREVAAAGGVVGVWWRLSGSVAEYVAGIRSMVDAIGVDHVGIGTDTYLIEPNGRPGTDKTWPDENGGFFYAVAGEMLKQGFTPDEIGKIGGGNFCRVFGNVTAGHA